MLLWCVSCLSRQVDRSLLITLGDTEHLPALLVENLSFWLCVYVRVHVHVCALIRDQLFATPQPRLLCPWNFPGKNTGVGCHLFLQEIFQTRGSNLRLLSPALAGRFFSPSAIWEAPISRESVGYWLCDFADTSLPLFPRL